MNKLMIRSPLTRQQAIWCALAAVASITSGRAEVVSGLPSNPQVLLQSSGASTTFSTVTDNQGQTLTVNSSARRVVINWDSFDIAATNTVEFIFDDAGRAIAVNRVGSCPSGVICSGGVAAFINGTLRSNGNVWILASGGVYFSSTARVDVAGLLATPADLDSIDDFVNGAVDAPIGFTMPSFPGAVIVDPGAVIVGRGGATMLIGGSDGGSVGGRLEVRGRVGAPTSATGVGLDPDAPGGQVLYGAAGKFRLVMKERAPDSLSSGDLELFDFIIDEGYRVDSFGDPLAAIVVAGGSETRAEQVIIKAQRGEPDPNNPGSSAGIISSGSSSSSTTAQGIYIEAPINAYGEDRDGPFASALTIEGAGDTDVSISRGIDFFSNSISSPSADPLLPIVTLSSGGSIDIKGRDIEVLKIESFATSEGISATDIPDHVTVELQGTAGATLKASRDLTLQEVLLNGANLIADGNINLNYSLIDPLAGDINAGGRFDFIELPPDDSANPNDFGLTLGNITTVGDVAIVARGDIQAGNVDAGGRVDIRSSEQNLTVGGVQSDLGVSLEGSQAVTTGDVSAQDAVLLTAGGVLTTGNVVSAAGRAVLQAQSLSIGNVTAQLDADLTSTDGAIEAGDVASRSDVVNVKGSGDITLGSVTASSNITIKEVNTAGGQTPSPVNILSGNLDGAEIRVESRGSANLGDVTAAADLLVSADAGVRLRSATAASVSLSSLSGGVDVGLLESGGGLTGGSVLSRTGNVNIEARQAIRTGDVDSAALVRAVSSESTVSVGDVTADLSVELLGQTGVAAGVVAAQKFIRVQALEGDVDTGALTATEEKIDIDAL
ncbi:MAG: filamentous hemagglutinin N-terminal domain-containing protein, partial [Steroidobacteraceae bacterium]